MMPLTLNFKSGNHAWAIEGHFRDRPSAWAQLRKLTHLYMAENGLLTSLTFVSETFGFVEVDDKVYTLTQSPYMMQAQGRRPYYQAHAVDDRLNEYTVQWEAFAFWQDLDEHERFDWESPNSVIPL